MRLLFCIFYVADEFTFGVRPNVYIFMGGACSHEKRCGYDALIMWHDASLTSFDVGRISSR